MIPIMMLYQYKNNRTFSTIGPSYINTEANLSFGDLNYGFHFSLSVKITQLETQGIKLSEIITVILQTKK